MHEIPSGFLRVRFKTASEAESHQLAVAFSPLFEALLLKETGKQKLRIGIRGHEKFGKTSFANAIVEEGIIQEIKREFISKTSKHYRMLGGQWVSHYDARAADSFKIRAENNPDLNPEIESHKDHVKSSIAHLVEYPEMDEETILNILWDFRSSLPLLDRIEDSEREIDFYCTEEITEMPEYQQFLEDAAPFMIK